MPTRTFTIFAQATDKSSGQGIPGLTVKAFGAGDVSNKKVFQEATTGSRGIAQMKFTNLDMQSHFSLKRGIALPNLYFEVYRDKALLEDTEDVIVWKAPKLTEEGLIRLVIPIEQPEETYIVAGVVANPDGKPIPTGLKAQLFIVGERKETKVNEAAVKSNGNYEVSYNPGAFTGDQSGPNILLRVLKPPQIKVLAESPLFLNASPEEEVNLVLG